METPITADDVTTVRDWAVGATVFVTPEVRDGVIVLRAEIDWGTVIDGLRDGDEYGTEPVLIALAEDSAVDVIPRVIRATK
jgi:hypothetical protein